MIVSDISKRVLIYDNYEQAKSEQQSYLIEKRIQGVQIEQIDSNRWKLEIIYAVGDYYRK